ERNPPVGAVVVTQMALNRGESTCGAVESAVVTMHDAPECVGRDLEIQPGMTTGGVVEVPGIHGERALDESGTGVPSPRMRGSVCQGALHCGDEASDPFIIAGGLPRFGGGVDEAKLDVGLDGYAHPSFPVFAFAGPREGRRGDVVEDPPVGGLLRRERVDDRLEVGFEVFAGACCFGAVANPECRIVGAAVASDGRAVYGELGDIGGEEGLDPLTECRPSAGRCRYLEHVIARYRLEAEA